MIWWISVCFVGFFVASTTHLLWDEVIAIEAICLAIHSILWYRPAGLRAHLVVGVGISTLIPDFTHQQGGIEMEMSTPCLISVHRVGTLHDIAYSSVLIHCSIWNKHRQFQPMCKQINALRKLPWMTALADLNRSQFHVILHTDYNGSTLWQYLRYSQYWFLRIARHVTSDARFRAFEIRNSNS